MLKIDKKDCNILLLVIIIIIIIIVYFNTEFSLLLYL